MTTTYLPVTNLQNISASEAQALVKQGYVPRNPLFDETFANGFPAEIDRLIKAGFIQPSRDRMVHE